MFSLALGYPMPKFACPLNRPAKPLARRAPQAKRPVAAPRPAPERPAATWMAVPFPQWNGV
jgi:hypothetical protein